MKISPERMIEFVKIGTKLCGGWPPLPNASKRDLMLRQTWWIIAMTFTGHAMVQCFQGIIRKPDDPIKVTKTITEVGPTVLSFMKMAICRYHQGLLKVAYEACEAFLKRTTPREREVMQGCITSCTPLYVWLGFSSISAWCAFASTPLYVEGLVKVSEIQYALPYEDTKIMTDLIYLSEVITIAIATSAAFVDMEIGILLWYCGTRFQVLSEKFMEAATAEDFDLCIIEHQELLTFVENVVVPTRKIALSVTGVLIFGSICSAYQLVSDEPAFMKFRFVLLLGAMALEVLMYSWPSDYVKTTSAYVATAAFHAPWVEGSRTIPTKIYFVMMRAQNQVIVKIDGFLPQLDMEFYKNYLTTSFSYFTTLRAVTAS